jgi:hypothetical protein
LAETGVNISMTLGTNLSRGVFLNVKALLRDTSGNERSKKLRTGNATSLPCSFCKGILNFHCLHTSTQHGLRSAKFIDGWVLLVRSGDVSNVYLFEGLRVIFVLRIMLECASSLICR